jgi:NADH:ubiquinone oxidoreductase subunit K
MTVTQTFVVFINCESNIFFEAMQIQESLIVSRNHLLVLVAHELLILKVNFEIVCHPSIHSRIYNDAV